MVEMTVAQFAHKLKVDRSTVYRMINAKALPDGVEAFVVLGKIGLKVKSDFVWQK